MTMTFSFAGLMLPADMCLATVFSHNWSVFTLQAKAFSSDLLVVLNTISSDFLFVPFCIFDSLGAGL